MRKIDLTPYEVPNLALGPDANPESVPVRWSNRMSLWQIMNAFPARTHDLRFHAAAVCHKLMEAGDEDTLELDEFQYNVLRAAIAHHTENIGFTQQAIEMLERVEKAEKEE